MSLPSAHKSGEPVFRQSSQRQLLERHSLPAGLLHGRSTAKQAPHRYSSSSIVWLLLAAIIVTPLLTACGGSGFRPMYAASSDGSGLIDKLARVEVTTIPGRAGQLIRNELLFHTRGAGQGQSPKYRLRIVLRERVVSTLVNREGNAADNVYTIDATFQLFNIKTKALMFSGTSFGRAGFERFKPIYSNVRAQRDAKRRAAQTIARDIKSRLEGYLAAV